MNNYLKNNLHLMEIIEIINRASDILLYHQHLQTENHRSLASMAQTQIESIIERQQDKIIQDIAFR